MEPGRWPPWNRAAGQRYGGGGVPTEEEIVATIMEEEVVDDGIGRGDGVMIVGGIEGIQIGIKQGSWCRVCRVRAGRGRGPSNRVAEVYYTVDNPSPVMYPVHSYLGSVWFRPLVDLAGGRDRGVEMVWNVMVRPMAGFEAFVRLFTEMVVIVFVRNLKVNLEEGSDERRRVDGDGVWVVRSDSWVGGVMVARSLDRRAFGERAGDFLRP